MAIRLMAFGMIVTEVMSLSSNPDDMKYFHYRSPTDKKEIIYNDVNSIVEFNKDWPLVIVIDGYLSHYETPMSQTIKNRTLLHGPSNQNVIVVDWSALSGDGPNLNVTEFAYIAKNSIIPVGSRVGDFIRFLYGLPGPSHAHIIGHSLGAHIAGNAGRQFEALYGKKINRISGLDPAGPYFNSYSNEQVQKGNATFVDLYHTSRLVLLTQGLGVAGAVKGDLNIFVNGGTTIQPGCSNFTKLARDGCNHSFSWRAFAASYNEDFSACPCSNTTCHCPDCNLSCTSPIPVGYKFTSTVSNPDCRLAITTFPDYVK